MLNIRLTELWFIWWSFSEADVHIHNWFRVVSVHRRPRYTLCIQDAANRCVHVKLDVLLYNCSVYNLLNVLIFVDSPRVSDPNIPLVARKIMQRMIRQFAAEYTSKTSSTQDSSSPNSTKNQSLLKASPVASSSAGATAQNPVLSKLLMADQDSPLDLTVRKSQLDPSEQGMHAMLVFRISCIHLKYPTT